MSAALTARGLARRFDGLTAVDQVDLDVLPGQVTGLIGPNGAGKSTLFGCLTGVERPDAGRVLLGDRDITRRSPDARARLGVVQTFQVPSLFTSMTVEDNLRVGAENRGRRGWRRGLLGLSEPDRRRNQERVDRVLDQLGMAGMRDMPAGKLPTGALRLVELGRALCVGPSVLLLDEPASGLDGDETDRLAALVREVAAGGVAILLVDHDVELVFGVADVVYAMAAGRVVAEGTPDEIAADPTVRATYLESVTGAST